MKHTGTYVFPLSFLYAQLPPKYRKTKNNPEPEEIALEEAIELVLEKRARDSPATARARAKKAGGKGRSSTTAAAGAGVKGTGKKRKGKKKADSSSSLGEKKKRPLSGFFRFCKESREARAAAMAAGGAEGTTLNNEMLSGRWKALAEEERAEFNAAASAALEQWKMDILQAKNGGGSGSGKGGKSTKSGGGGGVGVKAPKNAYILFSCERRPGLKQEIGEAVTAVEMTKKLAQEWRELEGSTVREEYVQRAALLKQAWLEEKQEAAAAAASAPRGAASVWVGGGVGGAGAGKKPTSSATKNAASPASV